MKTFEIRAVALQEDGWWVAQCLEYDIAAMAKSLPDLDRELHRVIECHMAVDRQKGRLPFQNVGKAPDRFWKMWEKSEFRLEKTLAVPSERGADAPDIRPHIRIAERLAA